MNEESSASDKVDDFMNMKFADLREKCRSRGLPVTGTKAQLASRLQAYMTEYKATRQVEDATENRTDRERKQIIRMAKELVKSLSEDEALRMSDESSASDKVDDFMNMKVADLREKCRSRGLPVTGTKAQLASRLQADMTESKEAEPAPALPDLFGERPANKCKLNESRGVVLTAGPLFDFRHITGGEDDDYSRVNRVNPISAGPVVRVVNPVNVVNPVDEVNPVIEVNEVIQENEDIQVNEAMEVNEVNDSPTTSVEVPNSNPASIPLKKRAVAPSATENVPKVEKKIVLKRDHIPTPIIAPKSPVPVPSKSRNVITATTSGTTDLSEKVEDATETGIDKERKSVIRLAKEPVKSLSEGEKFNLRAERFKTSSVKDSSESKNMFSTLQSGHSAKIISSSDLSSLETLKKRAERFGQNVSSVMKKMEDEEKILKRKSKFGSTSSGNGVSSTEEQEKKKKRAERFGM